MRRSILSGIVVATGAAITLHVTRPTSPDPSSDCEKIYAGLIRQPVNTLSALGIAGLGLFLITRRDRRQRILGAGVAIAGTGSVLAHATLHPVADRLDGIGVVVLAIATIGAITGAGSDARRLLLATGVLSVGVVIWAGSRTGRSWCEPEALVSGHAVWHVLVILATLLAASALKHRDVQPNLGLALL